MFELRSTVSLCRLLNPDSRSTVVRDLLKPACNWFAEKDVVPDLVEARNSSPLPARSSHRPQFVRPGGSMLTRIGGA